MAIESPRISASPLRAVGVPDGAADQALCDSAATLNRIVLMFAIAYDAFIIGPAFLSKPFGLYPLMNVGDAFDVLTPLVIIPLYWALFRVRAGAPVGRTENIVFLVLTALWVEGQGMHLSANSIGHPLATLKSTTAYQLAFFYDDILSHYLWHIGVVGLATMLLIRQWRYPFPGSAGGRAYPVVGGLIYGFTTFVSIVEASTGPVGVPFAILVVAFGAVWGRAKFREQPVLTFLFTSETFALILFAMWGTYWGGLPEFSHVGIIQ